MGTNRVVRKVEGTRQNAEGIYQCAAHWLRTPAQPILGLSEVLLSKKGNIEDYFDLVSAINRNAKRLQHLTEDILDVTRIESNTLILHKEEVDVCEKISNVIDDIKDQINDPGKLRVVFNQPKNPVYVSADKTRLPGYCKPVK